MLRISPDNESYQGNEHDCACKQEQAKEPECERIGNIAQRRFLVFLPSCFSPLRAIFTEIRLILKDRSSLGSEAFVRDIEEPEVSFRSTGVRFGGP
jgi:hypothetical protein